MRLLTMHDGVTDKGEPRTVAGFYYGGFWVDVGVWARSEGYGRCEAGEEDVGCGGGDTGF